MAMKYAFKSTDEPLKPGMDFGRASGITAMKGKFKSMENHWKTGFCFGFTSGIITTLGLMVGLHSGTNSTLAVAGGVVTIAIADAFSDALGIHIAKESENHHTQKEIWCATVSTFLSKFLFALTFLVPILLFDLSTAVKVSVVWGMSLLAVLSYVIGKAGKEKTWKVVAEHLLIAAAVILITHQVGDWVSVVFV